MAFGNIDGSFGLTEGGNPNAALSFKKISCDDHTEQSLAARFVRKVQEGTSDGIPHKAAYRAVKALGHVKDFSGRALVNDQHPFIGFETGAGLRSPGDVLSVW